MCVLYENMQECFMIKALFGYKLQKPIQAYLKKDTHCDQEMAMDINRQVLKAWGP